MVLGYQVSKQDKFLEFTHMVFFNCKFWDLDHHLQVQINQFCFFILGGKMKEITANQNFLLQI